MLEPDGGRINVAKPPSDHVSLGRRLIESSSVACH